MGRMTVLTVGVCAYNEEKNIASCIRSVLMQQGASFQLREVLVVCSGCTDGTEAIVEEMSRQDRRVRLLVQKRREGKCSAHQSDHIAGPGRGGGAGQRRQPTGGR